jgi:hypothetical protein
MSVLPEIGGLSKWHVKYFELLPLVVHGQLLPELLKCTHTCVQGLGAVLAAAAVVEVLVEPLAAVAAVLAEADLEGQLLAYICP